MDIDIDRIAEAKKAINAAISTLASLKAAAEYQEDADDLDLVELQAATMGTFLSDLELGMVRSMNTTSLDEAIQKIHDFCMEIQKHAAKMKHQ
ncbi:hypothetical protein [Vogesella sp. XCS3]|uniref:hypothetical protein n=1 Tax=Vogesella sp. XCS3 TaxID=2877939 RepID=UPI001D0AA48E|nr:hypothetical protein [Vogesella sp. XCS3]UDM18887.1 hypothetical protein LCH97_18630 [Vogesella sp. XCS3]